MFDMDEPGQDAALACVEIFSPGKCKVAHLPRKDPNEMLVAGEVDQIISAVFQAKTIRPDGIIPGDTLWDEIMKESVLSNVVYPYPALNDMMYGQRRSEVVVWDRRHGCR